MPARKRVIVDLHQDFLGYIDAGANKTKIKQTSVSMMESKSSLVDLVIASTFDMRGKNRIINPRTVDYSEKLMKRYRELCEQPDWQLVLEAADLERNPQAVKLIIHIEGIQSFSEEIIDDLEKWYSMGCRSIGPMWNLDNGLGGSPSERDKGLTNKGREVIEWIDRKPMVLDVSHMSNKTFWDTLELTDNTLIASHSNAKSLCDHPRNLDDDQILALRERGGVIGLVFSQGFINKRKEHIDKGLPSNEDISVSHKQGTQNLDRLVKHANHIANIAGIESLGIGTDFGGIRDPIPEISSVELLYQLIEVLEKEFGKDAHKILYSNSIRALHSSL